MAFLMNNGQEQDLLQSITNHKSHFMQKISTFLWFNDNAEEAMNFYLSIFKDSKVIRVAHNPKGSPGPEGALLVASIQLEGQEFVLMNGGPGHPLTDAISLTINCNSQEEVDYYWNKLIEGGGKEVACGWLTDKFGLCWQIVPENIGEILKHPKAMAAMMKIQVTTQRSASIGFGLSVVRYFAHFLDAICYIGYLWPLWDDKRQTFADKIMTTVCLPL